MKKPRKKKKENDKQADVEPRTPVKQIRHLRSQTVDRSGHHVSEKMTCVNPSGARLPPTELKAETKSLSGDIEDIAGPSVVKRPFDSVSSMHQKMREMTPHKRKAQTNVTDGPSDSSKTAILRILEAASGIDSCLKKEELEEAKTKHEIEITEEMNRGMAMRVLDLTGTETIQAVRAQYR